MRRPAHVHRVVPLQRDGLHADGRLAPRSLRGRSQEVADDLLPGLLLLLLLPLLPPGAPQTRRLLQIRQVLLLRNLEKTATMGLDLDSKYSDYTKQNVTFYLIMQKCYRLIKCNQITVSLKVLRVNNKNPV